MSRSAVLADGPAVTGFAIANYLWGGTALTCGVAVGGQLLETAEYSTRGVSSYSNSASSAKQTHVTNKIHVVFC